MDIKKSTTGGSLQISSDVIAKIAKLAASESDGVVAVAAASNGAGKTILDKIAPIKPIVVQLNDEVADIEVSIVVRYSAKIPEVSEAVQKNIKTSVQNMTGITVAKVDVIVVGVEQ